MPSAFLNRLPALLDRRFALIGWLSVLAQLAVVLVNFRKLIFHPRAYLIVNHFDGIKSYFAMESLFRQPLRAGTLVKASNYPFGESLLFTDTAPLVSQPLHLLVQAVPALAPYGLYFFDLFIISGLVLSTWLLHRILRPLDLPGWVHMLACVALPWLSPQTFRLMVGHLTLTYEPALLLPIWLLQTLYARHAAGRPLGGPLVGLALSIGLAAYLHIYYVAIVGALVGLFATTWVIELYLARQPWQSIALRLGTALGGAIAITALSLRLLDPRYTLRSPNGNGYDWGPWKLQIGAFFQALQDNRLRFPFEPTNQVSYESTAYLGAFVLYTLLVALILRLARRLTVPQLRADHNSRFLRLLLLATVPMVLMALGENIDLDNGTYVVHNYLNPLFWLHKVTDRVTQFRVLGRYVWPFWWAVNLAMLWLVVQWSRRETSARRWLMLPLVLLLVPDLLAAGRFYRHITQLPNVLTVPANRPEMQKLLAGVSMKNFQAILPIPFYHVGSEGDFSLTTDPDDPHSTRTFQLAALTNLPLMSHKAARTPPYQAELLWSLFRRQGPARGLLNRLDARPILVYFDTAYYDGRDNFYRDNLKDRPAMRAAFERGDDFVREWRLQRLRRVGRWALYAWYPQQPKPPLPPPPRKTVRRSSTVRFSSDSTYADPDSAARHRGSGGH